jgi:periplasmic divalent cation tolerance protein
MRPMTSAARVVLITTPNEESAREIARSLVDERLLACASIVPRVTSIFRWEGAVQEESEALLVGKTTDSQLEELEKRLLALHPYDVPECIALAPAHVEPKYLAWLVGATES